jgi:RsmE family RNA methyltransferase
VNILILNPDCFFAPDLAKVKGRQLAHIHNVLKCGIGDTLEIGLVNGLVGSAEIIDISTHSATIRCNLYKEPPQPLPVTLILALPRPKMMRRVIQTVASMGVKELFLINSYKVDKSYWSTPWLTEEALHENLLLGLEQAKDTRLPLIHQRKLFKPFVEDELAALSADSAKFIAHPGSTAACPVNITSRSTLVIGPEGGFTEYEVNKITEVGFTPINMGSRIFRVETAIPALLAKIFPFSN